MATRTKPLMMSAAALASAAAVAVASPSLAPSFGGAPTTTALSKAAYELTTFSDVFTIPTYIWTDVLFNNYGWGNVLGPSNYPVDPEGNTVRGGYGPAWAQPQNSDIQYAYVNPWAAGCNYACTNSGVSGVAYMFLDALVNGNGQGYQDINGVLTDPSKPYDPTTNPYVVQPWGIGPVNYLFEPYTEGLIGGGSSPFFQLIQEGYSATAWYALQGTIGQALPILSGPINDFFWGTYQLTFAWNRVLYVAAELAAQVPLVGPFVGNSILAYLGDLPLEPGSTSYYQYGLSGTLNYWVDILTGTTPWPTELGPFTAAATRTASAVKAAQATVAAVTTAATAVAADVTAAIAPATTDAAQTKTEATAAATATDAAASAGSATATAVTATATTTAATATEPAAQASTSTTAASTTAPAADTTAAPSVTTVDSTAAASTDSSSTAAAAKPTRKRPVRDAVAGAAKAVTSAVSGAAKSATGGAAAAKAGAAASNS